MFVKNGVFISRLKKFRHWDMELLWQKQAAYHIVDLRLWRVSEALENLLRTDRLALPPEVVRRSETSLRTCISNKVPGDATGLGITFETYCK